MNRYRLIVPVLAVLAIVVSACDLRDPADCVCTEQFVTLGVYVVDATGKPVEELRLVVTVPRTGDTLHLGLPRESGYHYIADDRMTGMLPDGGEWIRAEGWTDRMLFVQPFLIGTDPCFCHVEKHAGPDTIVVR